MFFSESLDLSAYDVPGAQKAVGQALCTQLLSLLDGEKKKLLALRSNLKPLQIEDISVEVAELVQNYMSQIDISEIFAPIKGENVFERIFFRLKWTI